MKLILSAAITASLFLSSCSTGYMTYQGAQVQQGTGGASVNVKGVDIWMEGSPPRKYQVIGVITDERPGGPLYMAARNGKIASVVKQRGGDAAIIGGDERNFMGTYNRGSSFTTVNATAYRTPYGANAVAYGNTSGSGVSVAAFRRNSKYYVIKYL